MKSLKKIAFLLLSKITKINNLIKKWYKTVFFSIHFWFSGYIHSNCTQQQNTCATVLAIFLSFLQRLSFQGMLTVGEITLLLFKSK